MRFNLLSLALAVGLVGCDLTLPQGIDLVDSNLAKDIDAGGNRTVLEGELVTLSGSLVGNLRGPDDGAPAFQWRQTDGPAVFIENATTLDSARFRAPATSETVVVRVELTALIVQGSGESARYSDMLEIVIQPSTNANAGPLAGAGRDQLVSAGAAVSLDAGDSVDSEGTPLTYQWSQVEGPRVELERAAEAIARFTAPRVAVETRLRFRVEVRDLAGALDSDDVDVTVLP